MTPESRKDDPVVYVVQGVVTCPDAHMDAPVPPRIGDVEWQFSDGPAGDRSTSADFIDLADGLRAFSGHRIVMDDAT